MEFLLEVVREGYVVIFLRYCLFVVKWMIEGKESLDGRL